MLDSAMPRVKISRLSASLCLQKSIFGKFIMSTMELTLITNKRNNHAFSYYGGKFMVLIAANLWSYSQLFSHLLTLHLEIGVADGTL